MENQKLIQSSFEQTFFFMADTVDNTQTQTDTSSSQQVDTNTSPVPEITDDQLLELLSARGIKTDSFESLKQKNEYQIPAPDPTDEQKIAAERAKEKKLLDAHIARGGTVEQFTAVKQIASAPASELGAKKIKEDLIKAGFSPEQAEKVFKDMHFDISDEDLEGLDEEEKTLKQKLRDFGKQKQENRGKYLQNTAKQHIESLLKELQQADEEKAKIEQHASNVEAALKAFNRKQTLNLGQLNGEEIAPIEYEMPEEVLSKTADVLKDAVKFDNTFFNKDGSVNIEAILPFFVKATAYDSAVKTGYLTGMDRQVQHIKAKFSSTVPPLGGAQKPQTGSGKKIVRVGQVQVAKFPQNN